MPRTNYGLTSTANPNDLIHTSCISFFESILSKPEKVTQRLLLKEFPTLKFHEMNPRPNVPELTMQTTGTRITDGLGLVAALQPEGNGLAEAEAARLF